MAYTTSNLLDAIKRRSFAPAGQLTFTDTELLAIADEVMATEIVPAIISVREEYFVFTYDYSVTASQAGYDIPARAVGLIVRDVWLVDGTSIVANLPRIEPETISSDATGTPEAFYLRNNQVMLYPTPATTAKTLRISFLLAPGRLIETSSAGLISAIDTGNNIVTVSAIPSTWATGDVFDLIKKTGGQEPWVIDQTSSLVSGSSITFSSLPTGLAVGDYVALSDETPLPFLPPNLRPILAQGVAAQVLSDMNQPGAEKAVEKFKYLLSQSLKLLTPRVQGEDRTITPTPWF